MTADTADPRLHKLQAERLHGHQGDTVLRTDDRAWTRKRRRAPPSPLHPTCLPLFAPSLCLLWMLEPQPSRAVSRPGAQLSCPHSCPPCHSPAARWPPASPSAPGSWRGHAPASTGSGEALLPCTIWHDVGVCYGHSKTKPAEPSGNTPRGRPRTPHGRPGVGTRHGPEAWAAGSAEKLWDRLRTRLSELGWPQGTAARAGDEPSGLFKIF